jgi:hypothetical protein
VIPRQAQLFRARSTAKFAKYNTHFAMEPAAPPPEAPRKLSGRARTLVFYPGSIRTWITPPKKGQINRLPAAFEALWHPNDKSYARYAALCQSRESHVASELARGSDCYGNYQDLFDRAAATETSRDIAALSREINALPSPVLKRACRTLANTTLGNKGESVGLRLFEDKFQAKVERPAERYSVICAVRPPDFILEVRGRVDGKAVVDGRPTVLEVKTRTRQLFNHITDQERVQLEFYLRLLNYTHGMLIETHDGTIATHSYVRNDDFYRGVMGRLVDFAQRFMEFLDSHEARLRYVRLPEHQRAEFVAAMIRGEGSFRPGAEGPASGPARWAEGPASGPARWAEGPASGPARWANSRWKKKTRWPSPVRFPSLCA